MAARLFRAEACVGAHREFIELRFRIRFTPTEHGADDRKKET